MELSFYILYTFTKFGAKNFIKILLWFTLSWELPKCPFSLEIFVYWLCLWVLLTIFFPLLHLWLCSLERFDEAHFKLVETNKRKDIIRKALSYILVQVQLIDRALHSWMTKLQSAKWKISMLDLRQQYWLMKLHYHIIGT